MDIFSTKNNLGIISLTLVTFSKNSINLYFPIVCQRVTSLLRHVCTEKLSALSLHVSQPLEKLKPEASEVQFIPKCMIGTFQHQQVELYCQKSSGTFGFYRFKIK